jgi:excisionase family DNA binding protein
MGGQAPGRNMVVKRPGRSAMVREKRAASAMGSPDDLAAALGVGRNKAYELLTSGAVPALRHGRRWLIPRATISKLASGEQKLV